MRRRLPGLAAGLVAVLVAAGLPGQAAADCDLTPARHYPVLAVLRGDAVALDLAEYERIDPAFWTDVDAVLAGPSGRDYRAAVTEALAPLSPEARDLMLLALLERVSLSTASTVPLTTASPSSMAPEFLALLDRHGLTGQAGALRAAQAAFPDWGEDAGQRRLHWTGAGADPAIDATLTATSQDWAAARPTVTEALAAHLAAHPDLAAPFEARRKAATAEERWAYLSGLLWSCVTGEWWSPAEAEAALAPLPPAARDLLLAHVFQAESFNGSAHQFFSNSSGLFAPDWAEALDRMGLPDQAAAIRQGMAAFGPAYPRDTAARRAIMARFTPAQDAALEALTWVAEDAALLAALEAYARKAGLWPE